MTTREQLDDRYGRTSRRSTRIAWIAIAAVAAVVIGWLVWTVLVANAKSVDVDDLGFEVASDSTVSVSFRITSTGDAPVVCIIEAQDESFGIVGWKVVELPPAGSVSKDYTEQVPTLAEATTGFVNSCSLR
ncbi:DUF4307 domain-containing protein [Microbacterium sp. G2-8]|uniref:DUF4307 domain-containing protein n=1 Tax=Microbacterium sp. G2-8 TaxID=2842454 RepID=UPI001C88E8C6|nr:DUF4307 domain-containing protein [Microbacterium sp. G2-8]